MARSFLTVQAAEDFIKSLNIPEAEIEKVERQPQIFRDVVIHLKRADCDLITIEPDYEEQNDFRKVYTVRKRYYMAPASLSDVLGMNGPRYKTPNF